VSHGVFSFFHKVVTVNIRYNGGNTQFPILYTQYVCKSVILPYGFRNKPACLHASRTTDMVARKTRLFALAHAVGWCAHCSAWIAYYTYMGHVYPTQTEQHFDGGGVDGDKPISNHRSTILYCCLHGNAATFLFPSTAKQRTCTNTKYNERLKVKYAIVLFT